MTIREEIDTLYKKIKKTATMFPHSEIEIKIPFKLSNGDTVSFEHGRDVAVYTVASCWRNEIGQIFAKLRYVRNKG